MTRTRITDMFPSRYIKADDVKNADGGELELTITGIDSAELPVEGGAPEVKYVLGFRDYDRGLILNRTRADELDDLFKSDVAEDWIGKRIRLHVVPVKYQGRKLDGIRIKAARPAEPSAAAVAATSTSQIPF